MNGSKNNLSTIAANLHLLMEYHGIGEKELERKIGVSHNLLSNDRHRNPTLRNLEKLARAFNVPVWKLLIPDQTVEQLQNHSVDRLVTLAVTLSEEAADYLVSVAARESSRRR